MNDFFDETAKDIAKQKETVGPITGNIVKDEEGKIVSLGKIADRKEYSSGLPETGFKALPITTLPSQGLFYPEGTTIAIKMASVKEIRHFSTIDENDYMDGDDKLNYILESCCKVRMPNNPRASWKDLQDIDKFFVIFCIREATFINGENKLTMNVSCPTCGNIDLIELNKNNLSFFNIDERLMRYYDSNEKTFVIRTKDGDEFPIYLPTIGVGIFIKNYIRSKIQNRDYYDKTFMKMAPFLFKDFRLLNESSYKAKNEETLDFGHKKLSIFSGIIDLFAKSISTDIQHTCSSCSSEVAAPINFQGGIKSLFLYTDIFDELA